jgi:hypothetical protein
MLLLPEQQYGKTWRPSKKAVPSEIGGCEYKNILSNILVLITWQLNSGERESDC